MSARPLICGFLKVRNEFLRGNLLRCLDNLRVVTDCLVVCDDGSTDGTLEHLEAVGQREPGWLRSLLRVDPAEQDFRRELWWKQALLTIAVDPLEPRWVWWVDGDETLDAAGTQDFRAWAQAAVGGPEAAWRFHYTQLWGTTAWARTDASFDEASFLKLWRWRPGMTFHLTEKTHQPQFPEHLFGALEDGAVGVAPFEVIHWGNVLPAQLKHKVIQYQGGLGGVARHRDFEQATYRPVRPDQLPPGTEWLDGDPQPFSPEAKRHLAWMHNLRGITEAFTVLISTYNRGATGELALALDSLLAQTWPWWVAVILDDGSEDNTPAIATAYQQRDVRIFACRYPEHHGGVWVMERGLDLACEFTAWASRLGSDDQWGPDKLAHDAAALLAGHQAVYGPYQVIRQGALAELCNPPLSPEATRQRLLGDEDHAPAFAVSWANFAVATSLLREIKAAHGAYMDPRLRNMDDFLLNVRIAQRTPWVWRGKYRGQLVLNPPPEECARLQAEGEPETEPDAFWTAADAGGASSPDHAEVYNRDLALTHQLIRTMRAK